MRGHMSRQLRQKELVVPILRESVSDLDMFVAGKVEADEPLTVEQPRRRLQQRNPTSIVFDQVVVGRDNLT